MNLSDPELKELELSQQESESLVRKLTKEYKTFSDLMAKKSRLTVLESNYDYLVFRAAHEIRKSIDAAREMISKIDGREVPKIAEYLEQLDSLEKIYKNEYTEFRS